MKGVPWLGKNAQNLYKRYPMMEAPTAQNPVLCEQIAPLLENLLYPSESDEPVEMLSLPWTGEDGITVQKFAELSGIERVETIVEKEPERFWSPVTVDQEWYGDEERERTARFTEIKRILEENSAHIRYFEVGEVEVGLYWVGQADQSIVVLKTMAVRT